MVGDSSNRILTEYVVPIVVPVIVDSFSCSEQDVKTIRKKESPISTELSFEKTTASWLDVKTYHT